MTTHEQNPSTSQQRKSTEEQTTMQQQGQGSERKQRAQETAGQVTQKARETASEAAHQAKEQTRELAETAKQEARSMAETRKSQVTSELDNIVQAFRTTGRELETRNEEPVARYATQIADRLEGASGYLRQHSIDDILADAEDFARRQPELFLGGAFGLGFLVSRFFKSSERNLYEGQYRGTGYYGYGDYSDRDYYERSGSAYAPRSYGTGTARTGAKETGMTSGQTRDTNTGDDL